MKGHSIAGRSTKRYRIENDFYATPKESIEALLKREEIIYPAWEPACGNGAIAKLLRPERTYASDLIYRGYGQGGVDFLSLEDVSEFLNDPTKETRPATIITNPPFNRFQEFAEKALEIAKDKVILFGKLQALEGKKRAIFMENSPLKTIYVFKSRQNPLRNGSPVNENGKPWASTMAFAWYVWEKGYIGNPVIKWI